MCVSLDASEAAADAFAQQSMDATRMCTEPGADVSSSSSTGEEDDDARPPFGAASDDGGARGTAPPSTVSGPLLSRGVSSVSGSDRMSGGSARQAVSESLRGLLARLDNRKVGGNLVSLQHYKVPRTATRGMWLYNEVYPRRRYELQPQGS